MKKKIIIAAIMAIVIILVSIIIYVLNKPSIKEISGVKLLWPTLNYPQKEIYFFNNEKSPAFYKFKTNNSKIEKISKNLDTPDSIIWSPNLKNALIYITYNSYIFGKYNSPFYSPKLKDGEQSSWIYNFETGKLTFIEKNLPSAIWKSENEILYIARQDNNFGLNTINTTDLTSKEIKNFGQIYLEKLLKIVDGKIFLLATPGEGIRNLYEYSIENDRLNQLAEDVSEEAIVSDKGEVILFELKINSQTMPAWLDLKNGKYSTLKLRDKISFSESRWIDERKLLLDAGNSKVIVYDTSIEKYKVVYKNKTGGNISDFMVSPDGRFAYFLINNSLYKIRL